MVISSKDIIGIADVIRDRRPRRIVEIGADDYKLTELIIEEALKHKYTVEYRGYGQFTHGAYIDFQMKLKAFKRKVRQRILDIDLLDAEADRSKIQADLLIVHVGQELEIT